MGSSRDFKTSETEIVVEEIVAILAREGIVLLPTETVYGLFVRSGSPRARQRLFQLKRRPDSKAVAEYVRDVEDAERRFGPLPPQAVRLAEAFWPGPLTLVLRTEPSLGLRCARHPIFPRLLESVPEGIVGTSANITGEAPAHAIRDVAPALLDGVDAAIADDAAVLGRSSTVLGLPAGEPELPPSSRPVEWIRTGEVAPADVAPFLPPRITFVCTGNTCRSPMARAIATELWPSESLGDVVFHACGLSCAEGEPASDGALFAATELGLDLSAHRSQPATRVGLLGSDVVLVMTESHRRHILSVLPRLEPRVIVLGDPHGIPDPFGGSSDIYMECARSLKRSISRLIKEWMP